MFNPSIPLLNNFRASLINYREYLFLVLCSSYINNQISICGNHDRDNYRYFYFLIKNLCNDLSSGHTDIIVIIAIGRDSSLFYRIFITSKKGNIIFICTFTIDEIAAITVLSPGTRNTSHLPPDF